MRLSDYLEKWGRALFESPLAIPSRQEEPPELAEIRLALLDEVRSRSYRAAGKRVFPFDRVRVFVRGVEASRAAVFNGRFFRQYLEQELRHALLNAECRYPETLHVDVETTAALPARDEAWLVIESSVQGADPAPPPSVPRLIVVEGRANVAEVALDKSRINIGRSVNVYRSEGLFRRNDLAFEEDTEINRTVSREHAHISVDAARRDYRLHNDRWYPHADSGAGNSATWVVRDGMSEAVHRDPRGLRLQHGDEIHFGRVVVRFEAE